MRSRASYVINMTRRLVKRTAVEDKTSGDNKVGKQLTGRRVHIAISAKCNLKIVLTEEDQFNELLQSDQKCLVAFDVGVIPLIK